MSRLTSKDRGNEAKVQAYRNEEFWQVVSVEVLGNIRSTSAIRPLLWTVIDRNKECVAATAILALGKMAPESMAYLTQALRGGDADLESKATSAEGDARKGRTAVLRATALTIGTIGRKDGLQPLLQELRRNWADDISRAILAREIAKLPPSKASLRAVMATYESMPVIAIIPPNHIAKAVLCESLETIGNGDIVDRMIAHADRQPANEDGDVVRDATAVTVIKLMRWNQVRRVEAAILRWAPRQGEMKLEKAALQQGKGVLQACRNRVSCYLAKVIAPELQEKRNQFVGIKAAYMIGILGTDATRAEIVKALPQVRNPAISFILGQTLLRLAPDGDDAAVRALVAMDEDAKKSNDLRRIMQQAPLRHVRYRLEARGR